LIAAAASRIFHEKDFFRARRIKHSVVVCPPISTSFVPDLTAYFSLTLIRPIPNLVRGHYEFGNRQRERQQARACFSEIRFIHFHRFKHALAPGCVEILPMA